ncbi:MAG: hypothetical protein Q9225_004764 [Loekoesia sp. 1 TL-2023]
MSSLPSDSDSQSQYKPPSSILIVGAGAFGLSTTLALLSSPIYAQTHVTLIDPDLPSYEAGINDHEIIYQPSAQTASIDSSRIIRPDYANPAYAKLAAEAQEAWRAGFGGEDVYHESGFIVVAGKSGSKYVEAACLNVEESTDEYDRQGSTAANRPRKEKNIRRLANSTEIREAAGLPTTKSPNERTSGESEQLGSTGYFNNASGWANAEGAMRTMMQPAAAHALPSNALVSKTSYSLLPKPTRKNKPNPNPTPQLPASSSPTPPPSTPTLQSSPQEHGRPRSSTYAATSKPQAK